MRHAMIALAAGLMFSTSAFAQPMMGGTDRMMQGMSVEGRKIVAMHMIDQQEERKGHMEERKAAREKVRAAMTAEPYIAGNLRSAFEAERKVASEQQKDRQEQMIIVMGKLSAADRKIFADASVRMEERMKNMQDRRGKRGSAMPPRDGM
jgi:hypothetical protein